MVVVTHTPHLGGMFTSGLCVWDTQWEGYNWRTVVTDDPGNQLPVGRPTGYDREQVAAHPDLAAFAGSPVLADGAVPNRKARLNRPQLLDEQAAYADGTWAERGRIMAAHWRMLQGFLYYLRNDKSVSDELRSRWRSWALAADEFADNGACPYEIYARETRRLDGRAVFTGHDAMLVDGLERAPVRPTSIAATEWYIDSHACSPETVDGSWPQGKIALAMETFPGMVPYEALLPKHLDNLLVVNCVSSSHVGWNTIRLEPTWMNIGEAAGWAFVLARRAGVEPAAVGRTGLVRTLAAAGGDGKLRSMTWMSPAGSRGWPRSQYFGTQGFFAGYEALPHALLGRRSAEIWVRAAARAGAGMRGCDGNRARGPGTVGRRHRRPADLRRGVCAAAGGRRVRRLPAAAGRYPRGCLPTPVRAHRAPIEKDQAWQHPRVAPVLMDFDVDGNLGAVEGSVSSLERDGQPARTVTLSQLRDNNLSWDWRSISHIRPRQSPTKPLLPLRGTARRSSWAAARGGDERRSPPERTPMPRLQRQGAPPRSTLANRPNLADLLAGSR